MVDSIFLILGIQINLQKYQSRTITRVMLNNVESPQASQMIDENTKKETALVVQPKHLTQQEQILIQELMMQPFSYAPPPLFTQDNLRGYREGLSDLIEPFTDHYEMFGTKYSLKTSKPIDQNNPDKIPTPHRICNLKQKIFNLKFIGYTILTTMIETLKNVRKQDPTNEKLKNSHSLIKRKIEQFFEEANQLKETFRRLQVIHLLEKEAAYLETETKSIQAVIDKIQEYVLEQSKRKMT